MISVGKNKELDDIDNIAKTFNIKPELLFEINTAQKAKELPQRVDMYIKKKNKAIKSN